jgi:homoserine dehydrogenase
MKIILLGTGGVGRALLNQIISNREMHAKQLGVQLDVVALTDSSGVVFDESNLSDDSLKSFIDLKEQGGAFSSSKNSMESSQLEDLVSKFNPQDTCFVDVTASDAYVSTLLSARQHNCSIVLANKLPLAGPFAQFKDLTSSRKTKFETTVAAALPVISTLQSYLLDTGDRVKSIQGCVSGTLNMVCQKLEAGEKISEIIRDAKAHGHTEPDPREDLGGRDAARKALILARLLGYELEYSDVEAEALYPSEWDALSVDEFMGRLPELDDKYREISKNAISKNLRLRYVIDVSEGQCKAGLQSLNPEDDIIRASVADSVVAFESDRYPGNPLIIRGRGSGPRLTASGVLSDILILSQLRN